MNIINIIHGDSIKAMQSMKDNRYRLALVDPPYGIGLDMIKNGAHGNKQKSKEFKNHTIHEIKDWNNNPPDKKYFTELHRVTIDQIIWGCNYYAKYIPAVGRIFHDKKTELEETKINFSHGDLASCSLQKRITQFRYRWSGNKQGDTINWNNNGPDGRIHPTQKPIALYKWLLKKYAFNKDGSKRTIFDSHGGSMSIVIACIDMGFDLDIYEIDDDYFSAACKRIKNHLNQLDLTRHPVQVNFIEQ